VRIWPSFQLLSFSLYLYEWVSVTTRQYSTARNRRHRWSLSILCIILPKAFIMIPVSCAFLFNFLDDSDSLIYKNNENCILLY
jgi:hypothetical protein